MRATRSFTIEELKENQKIIIYGAGRYGELALKGLRHLKLKPAYFADRALAGGEYFGIKVIDPNELINYKDEVILIASYNYFHEMLSRLKEYGNCNYYDILELIKLDYKEDLSEYLLDEKQNYEKYESVVESVVEGGLVVPHCELVLTERCTLRCKDCANLMQYYSEPENLDVMEIITCFNRFLASIDALSELRLLGGEPFLCKEIDEIIKVFQKSEKVKRITIYTNSTIIPPETILECLKNNKVSVHMSNYGSISNKVSQLKKIFEENNIKFYIHNYEKWFETGGLEDRGYSDEERENIYRKCIEAKCHTFFRGKFYICPRAAHGERLNIFTNKEDEIAEFTDTIIDVKQKREEIKALISRECSITACAYCNGMCVDSKEIDAAMQMDRKNIQ